MCLYTFFYHLSEPRADLVVCKNCRQKKSEIISDSSEKNISILHLIMINQKSSEHIPMKNWSLFFCNIIYSLRLLDENWQFRLECMYASYSVQRCTRACVSDAQTYASCLHINGLNWLKNCQIFSSFYFLLRLFPSNIRKSHMNFLLLSISPKQQRFCFVFLFPP